MGSDCPPVPRPPSPVTMAGFSTLPTVGKSLWCPRSSLPGPQGSSVASIGWVATTANSISPPSYDGLKGTGKVILVMP